ncbi:sensor histidine kinase [Pseudoduganella violaceinigra]|uniref:sensor histidine kinase n=1 Tax=Pseudoduganella violaceinigra TaxID=246602 RepID=UPI0013774F7C|nr:histidine kinase [Pseudoduganella violaceinigra]
MTAIASNRARITRNRYPAAALVCCLVFGILELTAPWAAGPERAEMNNLVARAAYSVASLSTPPTSLLRAGTERQELAFHFFMVAQAALVSLFIGLLWWRIRPGLGRSAKLNSCLLGVQFCIVLVMGSIAFSLAMATALAALLPMRRALVWLAALFVLGLAIEMWLLTHGRQRLNDADVGAGFFILTFERTLLILGAALAWLVKQERQTRIGLAAANAQLRATQSLLADTVRSSERLRIARDLHDAVGHHLTALKLHLDLATRQSASQPLPALVTANELTHTLLAEVRSVVSAERQEARVNLRHALELLCAGIPSPSIQLSMGDGVADCPPATAHTLLSCVQEAITNTVRHAGANQLTIDVQCDSKGFAARIADDGRGARGAPEGNGLSGMRERLSELGGMLVAGSGAQGFALEISVPSTGARA